MPDGLETLLQEELEGLGVQNIERFPGVQFSKVHWNMPIVFVRGRVLLRVYSHQFMSMNWKSAMTHAGMLLKSSMKVQWVQLVANFCTTKHLRRSFTY